ncbi:MAG: LamG domain-containing protein, partial [Chthoniobacterales bacterium]
MSGLPNSLISCARLIAVCVALLAAPTASARLLMWYPFNEGSGTAVHDASVNGNNLAPEGIGISWNVKSGAPFGGSIYFNGNAMAVASKTESEVEAHTIDFLKSVDSNKCTISLWVNPDIESQNGPPFGFSRGDLTRVLQAHVLQFGNCWFDVAAPDSGSDHYRAGLATTLATNTWTHFAFVYDGSLGSDTLKVYRNGVQIASSSDGVGSTVDWSQIALAALGGSQRYTDHWKGAMDDFAMWDEALTPTQIASLVSSGVASVAAPVINSFKATPGNIGTAGTTTLSWS